MALQLRPNCEYCDKDLPPNAIDARRGCLSSEETTDEERGERELPEFHYVRL